ncbi:hypothetical protein Xen7305DRAFT_00031750 [Xenococcus sp. PCC 7305]|uniref:hypothetical protein n=1 Tax=Xenococcus sp. PCC 7305 TaxID=102125 RepID=UPI0002ACF040|nr:hypothetical protein [Xenococcus sp. PCC 7305]ELS03451.1 hypothetical protein Xen7305DRAFT_00031750 [Xenococcus sp. PCC 7305]
MRTSQQANIEEELKKVVTEVEENTKETLVEVVETEVLDSHISQILALRNEFPVSNYEILSSNISLNRQIPQEIKKQIGAFQNKLRAVIERGALEIENFKYKSYEEALAKEHLTYNERNQATNLLEADKKINISFQSLKVATELFLELNKRIQEKIEDCRKSQNARLERDLVLANAILVYELSDFLISYLNSLKLEGIDGIKEVQRYINEKLSQIERKQQQLKARAESPEIIDEDVKQQVLSDIDRRNEAIQIVREEWSKYESSIEELKDSIGASKKQIPTLTLIRDNAESQIDILEITAIMQVIKNNVNALDSAIQNLKQVKLVSLTPDRITRLLNIYSD